MTALPLVLKETLMCHRGVAVGSSIGHAIGGLFGGGSPAAEQEGGAVASQGNESMQQSNTWGAANCDVDARNFTKCMDEHNGNMQICGWYMQQLVRDDMVLWR